ncbi:MAG: sugar ABC transporter ATP-binding protein [Mycobacterium sp.]
MSIAVSIRSLRKAFGTNEVLRGVDLDFTAGEVHALLGPNGAGKSTLLGCLSGAAKPDSGEIVIGGRTYTGFSPQMAFDAGTAIIYQHFQLIDDLSVADNIFLGGESVRAGGVIRKAEQRSETTRVLELVGATFDPEARVGSLTVGERQLVEIAKALRHQPSLLILDEPTAALSGDEAELLLDLVRRLATQSGIAVVYVTHLLREVLAVSDKVTVLRDGDVLWTRTTTDVDLASLVAAISSTQDAEPKRSETAERPSRSAPSTALLEVSDFVVGGRDPVDLEVRSGEIVGIFGLLGSGRTNLAEGLAGIRRGTGSYSILGRQGPFASPSAARRAGVVFVASDRKAQSLFGSMTASENLLMPHFRSLSRPMRRRTREANIFRDIADLVGLQPSRADLEADSFSGGNAQKLALGRWLGELGTASLMILDEPTQGVDVGARGEIYQLLRSFAQLESKAVLFVSSDPEEIMALADRIVVLVEGTVAGELSSPVDERELVALAHSEGDASPDTQKRGVIHA